MENKLVEFFRTGKSFSTPEGEKLICDSTRQEIQLAAQDLDVEAALAAVLNESRDPYVRRQLILALS